MKFLFLILIENKQKKIAKCFSIFFFGFIKKNEDSNFFSRKKLRINVDTIYSWPPFRFKKRNFEENREFEKKIHRGGKGKRKKSSQSQMFVNIQ